MYKVKPNNKDKQKISLSREKLKEIIKDTINQMIEDKGLKTYGEFLKILNKTLKASEGELYRKNK